MKADFAETNFAEIERLDHEIAELVVKRSELARAAGMRVGQLQDDKARFVALAERICEANGPGGLRDSGSFSGSSGMSRDEVVRVLMHVASTSQRSVDRGRICFLGPQYSYSHLAAIEYFGEAANFAPVSSIAAVFDSVHRGDAVSGLVPIENSTDGRVVDTLGMFLRRHMRICGEVLLPIHHNLLSVTPRSEIKEIHSKPQALSQCRHWLSNNFPDAKLVEVSSTTTAAVTASKVPGVAAVASLPAGQQYGLDLINSNIEDNQNNATRFAVLGTDICKSSGHDKTSLLFEVEHRPGALAAVMMAFRDAGLNLTWIESFPSPESRNEYFFFVEFTGHTDDQGVQQCIDSLRGHTSRLEILGSYPIAVLSE